MMALDFHVKVLQTFRVAPSSLGSGFRVEEVHQAGLAPCIHGFRCQSEKGKLERF